VTFGEVIANKNLFWLMENRDFQEVMNCRECIRLRLSGGPGKKIVGKGVPRGC
jgi:hypothetical protein